MLCMKSESLQFGCGLINDPFHIGGVNPDAEMFRHEQCKQKANRFSDHCINVNICLFCGSVSLIELSNWLHIQFVYE